MPNPENKHVSLFMMFLLLAIFVASMVVMHKSGEFYGRCEANWDYVSPDTLEYIRTYEECVGEISFI